jgi:hypothetical protein
VFDTGARLGERELVRLVQIDGRHRHIVG